MSSPAFAPFVRDADYAVRKDWWWGARRLLDFLLIVVTRGEMTLVTEPGRTVAAPGQAVLLQPGDLHEIGGAGETVTPFAHFDLFYNAEREASFPTAPGMVDLAPWASLLQPRLDDLLDTPLPTLLTPRDPVGFAATMSRLISAFQTDDPLIQWEAHSLAGELVVEVLRGERARLGSMVVAPRLGWVRTYLRLRLGEPLDVAAMAGRAGLSVSAFTRLFRREFGETPHQHLLNLRIGHAQELLRSTRLTSARIAAYCGFSDVYHFSKTFRRRTGMTPAGYRREFGATPSP
jgi:AraC-like DNA-binding protein